jgi:hypothetical protein
MDTSPDPQQLFRLFEKVAPAEFFEKVCEQHGYGFRRGVYGAMVVVWLMIWQRLEGNRSLAAAVQYLVHNGARSLRSDCKRWKQDKVSGTTGSYCQARQRLPKLIVSDVTQRVLQQLRAEMQEGWPGLQRPVFVVDGTTLQLPHEPELVKAYSPGRNQHGGNHWPVMQMVVYHDVFSGLALAPQWGAMYGEAAVSEQALAEQGLGRLPQEAVVLGDGNFGIFNFAYAVQQSGRPMILRLTQARARRIAGGALLAGMQRRIAWSASAWDHRAHPGLPEQATVEGRLMVCTNPSGPGELLYLFTTMDLPAEEILGMYKLRWNVETDLRSLKRTVGLQRLNSKSLDMVEKELLLAVAAYNLVRAVMCLTARRANLTPRQLSFSFVQTVVEAALPGLDNAATEEEYQYRLERMLRYAAQGKLPSRSRARSYPRQVWGQGGRFPRRQRTGQPEGSAK